MSSAINPLTSPGTTAAQQTTQSASSSDPLANESTFLTLLVSQLQNQDPLDPTDSTQFVSQLTAYSQLEQLMDIHQNTTTLTSDLSGTMPAQSTGATSGTGN